MDFRLRTTYHNQALHWICCAFIFVHIAMNQYIYAICDKKLFVDHDVFLLRGLIDYHGPVWDQVKAVLKALSSADGFANNSFGLLLTLWHFLLFGKSLFVFKMSTLIVFLALSFMIYLVAFHLTKKELFGLGASLIFVNIPSVVALSRKNYPYPLVAVFFLLFVFISLRHIERGKRPGTIAASLAVIAGSAVHPSSFIYLGISILALAWFQEMRGLFMWLVVVLIALASRMHMILSGWVMSIIHKPGLTNILVDAPNPYTNGFEAVDVFGKIIYPLLYATLIFAAVCAFRGARGRPWVPFGSDAKYFFLVSSVAAMPLILKPAEIPTWAFVSSYALLTIALVVLLSVIPECLPRRVLPAGKVLSWGGLLLLLYNVVAKADHFHYAHKFSRPVNAGKEASWRAIGGTYFLSEDVFNITPVLHFVNSRKRQTKSFSVLSCTIAMVSRNGRLTAANIGYTADCLAYDDRRTFYELPAYIGDFPVVWKQIYPIFAVPDGWFFDPVQLSEHVEKYKGRWAHEQLESRHIFLTVRNIGGDIYKPYSIGTVLDRMKEGDKSGTFDAFFRDAKPLAVFHVYKNIFLYVLERPGE